MRRRRLIPFITPPTYARVINMNAFTAPSPFSVPFSTSNASENLGSRGSAHYLHSRPIPANHPPEASTNSLPSSPFLDKPEDAELDTADKETYYSEVPSLPRKRPLHTSPWVIAVAGIVLAAIVALVVYAVASSPHKHGPAGNKSSDSQSGAPNDAGQSSDKPAPYVEITTGGDGSTVTKEDGSTFTYHNSFGGYWVADSTNPFDNGARANSWTPALNQTWTWGKDRINGVNLGGLFVLEPFIVPAIYEQNPKAVDEWTLSTALQGKGTLQAVLEDHYSTFITEEDLAQIAGAGLNWVRLPIPFWAVEVWDDVGVDADGQKVAEPFLAKVCWKYVVRVLQWARKYGLRVLLDLHTAPGSQNGFNHSGKSGAINWLNGVMGLANAQRSLDVIRSIFEFASQPEWQDVVPMVGVLNEPYQATVGGDQLRSFYYEAYKMVRNITGVGEGKGPVIAFHDGFSGFQQWAGFLEGADRIAIDDHPYFAFGGRPNRELVNVTADGGDGTLMGGSWPKDACGWADSIASSRTAFGISFAGEFSNAINDCGLWVIGVDVPATYGAGCDYWSDASRWSDETKQGLMNFAMASMDALGDWFFWTWKIGNSTTTNTVQAPLWSYQLGLEGGWMPKDPRQAAGTCAKFGAPVPAWDGAFQPWQTGGAGAGQIAPEAAQNVMAWPPPKLQNAGGGGGPLPQYASKGTPVTLAPPTFPATATVKVGNGWANPQDDGPAVTPIPGCAYPNAWDALEAQAPDAGCTPDDAGAAPPADGADPAATPAPAA
ncbi:glycoside hydrolase [Dichomitus squalens]|uniref:glucan 1,3-beta-glucosidase n=1 Tax=Dichomitus squalens TaxID=114155 RepID=A0A4Q9M961_9APHY|nr:glycoside hydrolase [Dichomitus squalens]